jgi:hypothetical protein
MRETDLGRLGATKTVVAAVRRRAAAWGQQRGIERLQGRRRGGDRGSSPPRGAPGMVVRWRAAAERRGGGGPRRGGGGPRRGGGGAAPELGFCGRRLRRRIGAKLGLRRIK